MHFDHQCTVGGTTGKLATGKLTLPSGPTISISVRTLSTALPPETSFKLDDVDLLETSLKLADVDLLEVLALLKNARRTILPLHIIKWPEAKIGL